MEDQKDRVEGDGSQMQECTAEITSSASSEVRLRLFFPSGRVFWFVECDAVWWLEDGRARWCLVVEYWR